MKALITIPLLLFWTTVTLAQKVRLQGDNSRHLCLNDSIAGTFEIQLKRDKIDSIITVLYGFDKGRLPNSRRIIIWTRNGTSRIRLVEGCDRITKDTTYITDLARLWDYIKATHFDDVTVPIKSGTGQSHDKFYHITVSIPHKSFFVVVRDNERKSSVKYKTPEAAPQVMLANKIDNLLN